MIDLEPIFSQIKSGDPVGAAYRLAQSLEKESPGRLFYDIGAMALARREELGDGALRFARIVFAEAVERQADLAEAHHDLATTMRELGMSEDAVTHYRRALELIPEDADSLIGLGAALCDTGRVDDALAFLRRAAEAHPDSGSAFGNLGVALEAAGHDREAVAAYAKAVARFHAEVMAADGEDAEAEAAARRRWARMQHAAMLERLECWPQSIAEFQRLLEEEQAIAEALEQEEEEEDDESPAEEPAPSAAESEPAIAGEAVSGDAGETLLDTGAEEKSDEGDDGESLDDEAEVGRAGLERVFTRMIQLKRNDLAFLVLDSLGGELSDGRTRATYTIYDPSSGVSTIMVEHWDTGARTRLDPLEPPVPHAERPTRTQAVKKESSRPRRLSRSGHESKKRPEGKRGGAKGPTAKVKK
ncbi:MAG: tetratricopeptide repeat protein [Deltaproteobacteria bacterium]|nr:tetratricopeptide repeat protein [Deltaproteobacteria bacterium]